jgi:nicotinamidase/pyrazinamidase
MQIRPDDLLLVVDIQLDFCPGGALAVADGDAIIQPINQIASRFEHVVLTQDWHAPHHLSFSSQHPGTQPYDTIELSYGAQTLWPDHCIQGSHGAEFHPDLDIPHASLILRKGVHRDVDSYSAFYENDHQTPTGLAGWVRDRGIRRIFVAGLALDFCVRYTAADGAGCGFNVSVIDDACRAVNLPGSVDSTYKQFHSLGLKPVTIAQILSAD